MNDRSVSTQWGTSGGEKGTPSASHTPTGRSVAEDVLWVLLAISTVGFVLTNHWAFALISIIIAAYHCS